MRTLDDASLSTSERHTLERLVELLTAELGTDLQGVWLYGSRARGEQPGEESDVDVLVVTDREDPDAWRRIGELADEAAFAAGANPMVFSVQVYSPERIAQRREIRSFFLQEVDRDKIVLAGEP